MPVFSVHDLSLGISNDLQVDANGDVSRSTTMQGIKQMLEFRVRTAFAEWQSDPVSVADLTKFIGRGNNQETGTGIEDAVRRALSNDSLFVGTTSKVLVVPTSPTEVSLFINVAGIVSDDGFTTTLNATFSLDFTTGHIASII